MPNLKTSSGQVVTVDPTDTNMLDQYKKGGAVEISNSGLNITPESLNPVTPIRLPEVPQDNTNYEGIIASGNQAATIKPVTGNTPEEKAGSLDTQITDILNTSQAPSSLSETYNTLYGQSGIDKQQAEVNAKNQIVNTATNELNRLNAEMAALNAEAKAAPIAIQQESMGQGRTVGGAAPLQTARLRDIALRSLPLEGQILGAQAKVTAAQGDAQTAQNMLNQAQVKFDRAFDIKSQDITNQYNFKKEQQTNILNYLSDEQSKQLAKIQLEEDRAYQDKQTNITDAKNMSKMAMEAGLPEVAGKLTMLDPESPTFKEDLAEFQSQITLKAAGWEYVNTPAERDALIAQGYEIQQVGGRTYAKLPDEATTPEVEAYVNQINAGKLKLLNVPASLRNAVAVALSNSPAATGGGGGGTTPEKIKVGTTAPEGYQEGDVFEDKGSFYVVDVEGKTRKATTDEKNQALSGLTPEEAQFDKDLTAERNKLAKGGSWAKSWNYLHNKYPEATNEQIDAMLDKEKYYTQK